MSRFNYSTSFDKDSDAASEADQNDIDKILKDTLDLDADLFGSMSKNTNLSKTLPASSNRSGSAMQKNRSFNFDDDPADIDAIIGKPKSNETKPAKQISFETEKKPSYNQLSSTMPASGSYAPSSAKTGLKSSIFDDIEDTGLLDTMGLDNRGQNKTKQASAPKPTENPSAKSKSLADELFGKSPSAKEEKPDSFEFKLNERYLNMSQQPAKTNDDDYQFGGYVPSAITNTPRTNTTSKRNVNFTDDLFGGDLSVTASSPARPKTTSAIANNFTNSKEEKTNNLSKTMPESSKDDWLSLIDSKPPSKKNSNDSSLDDLLRPRSDSITRASGNAPKQANTSDLDWLGFKDKDSDILSNSTSNIRTVSNSPAKSKPPPVPNTHSSAVNSPIAHLEDKQQAKFFNNKDSMNSSFADSIDNNMDNRPATSAVTQSNSNSILNVLNNIQPVKALDTAGSMSANKPLSKENELNSVAPSDAEDGWLNALITKKNDNKKSTPPNESNEKRFNPVQIEAITNKLNINYSNTANNNAPAVSNTNSQNFTKFKTSFSEQAAQYDTNEIQAMLQKLKQLEFENQDLHMQLQHNKSHYELQIQLVQDSCENRLRMIKEDRENSMRLFKEEKEALQAHIDTIEKEKQQLALSYKKKTDDIQREYDVETEKLRQIQRDAIEKLKEDHDEALRRVRHMKDTEVDAAMAASSHSRTIESVLNLIEDNTKNLDGLSEKVKMGHMINLNEQEVMIRNKEEALKIQEERLLKKQKEYENEIKSLNETIQRLENHLAEQSKTVAEERWKGKQHEKKMEALQDALLNEQRIVMERLVRERNDIERSKDDILNEQKRLMQQLYEEKRKIAEEKAHVEAAVAAYKDKQHKDSLNNINVEAEISVSTRRLSDEKARIEQMLKELKDKEAKLEQDKAVFEEKKQNLDTRAAKLEQMAAIVNKKYTEAEELFNKSVKEREINTKIMEQVNHIKATQETRLNQIQQQMANANEREAQLNKEKVEVYKQRQELELFKSNITCTKCKEPVKDFGLLGLSLPTSGYGTYIQANLMSTQNSQAYQAPLFGLQTAGSTLEDSKLLRQLKMQALKDRQFINEEKHFIETLGRNNSLNLLN